MNNPMRIHNVEFTFFQAPRIDRRLLEITSFVDALRRIEITIANPSLSVKFAQTCIPSLRNEPLFDLTECQRHVTDIYRHQITVLGNLNLKVVDFTDSWSTFTLGHRKRSSLDQITIDRALVNGAANIEPEDIEPYSRLKFFFYAKLLHELAHACLAEMGRQLPNGDYDDRFSSPATHALTGEAGDAIERHFFGSVVDALGKYTDEKKNVFNIDHVILREKRNKQAITSDFLCYFNKLNLAVLTSIPIIGTENLPLISSSKRKEPSSKSPRTKKFYSGDQQSPLKMATIGRQSQLPKWGWGPDAQSDDSDDDQPVLDSNGIPRDRVIMWKA